MRLYVENPADVVSRELSSDERLLWSGRPPGGLVLRRGDIFLIPFSLLWAGFAVFWEVGVLLSGGPVFMLVFGGFFVVIGLYIVAGRFAVDARRRAGTVYGLTDRRAIIITGGRVQSVDLRNLGDVTLRERPDGSGTLVLGPTFPTYGMIQGVSWPGISQFMPPTFELIEHVREVHRMLRDARDAL
jgi:hypothetical protein